MAIVLTLDRTEEIEACTRGILRHGEKMLCHTLEQLYHGNKPYISRIPGGLYVCSRVDSPRFGNTFEVLNVPNRKHILFHCGNTVLDTHGCVLVGRFAPVAVPAIYSSRLALQGLLSRLKGCNAFFLEINDNVQW